VVDVTIISVLDYEMADKNVAFTNEALSEGDYIPSSIVEWHEWLTEEEGRTFRVYKEDPNRFLADYRSEQQTIRDYEGREILELLQNANDAAAELGASGRVVISLSCEGLVVGNTGLSFSPEGIRSLRLAHLSPKVAHRKKYVGSKGLGFRSVLNWTTTPIILSGELRLAYSHSFLKQKQIQALEQIPELRRVLGNEPKNQSKPIIPLLTFPNIPSDGVLKPYMDNDCQKAVLKNCKQLIIEGFDTIIGMPFDKPEFYARALEQLKKLGHETLLFAPDLGEIEIRIESEEEKNKVWIKDISLEADSVQIISQNSDEFWEYKLFREEGEIPSEYLSDESDENQNFEVLIAVPTINSVTTGYLYSFFKTGVRFPYPLLAHATLELQANRELPQETSENRFVLSRLACLMTETAESLISSTDKWIGCQLLAKNVPELAESLTKMCFGEILINKAKKKKIIPTLGGDIKITENCRWLDIQDTSWLPEKLLPSLVEAPQERHISEFIKDLGIEELTRSEWATALSLQSFNSIKERACFIASLIQNSLLNDDVPIEYLIDESGKSISDECRIFLPPRDVKRHSLPEWIKVRFLNSELRDALLEALELSSVGALVGHLKVFRITEYSLQNVIGALVSETNRRITDNDKHQNQYTCELLSILIQLFPEEIVGRPAFPKEAGIRLKSQSGEFLEARKLYLGKGSGRYGALMQSLYGYNLDKLLVSPAELGLDTKEYDENKIVEFLIWLGVDKLPRQVSVDNFISVDFKKYVLSQIPYPAFLKINGVVDVTRDSPADWSYSLRLDKVSIIDELDEIISKSETEAILTWLSIDTRVGYWEKWLDGHCQLKDTKQSQRNYRYYTEPLPSYIIWKIRNTEWITTSNGKCKPSDCFFGEKRFGKLLTEPEINPEHPLFTDFDVWPNIIDSFNRAGVLTRLSHLEREKVYRLLIDLPDKDPEGKSTRNLYTLLLQHEDSFFGNAEKVFNHFKTNGMLWGRQSGKYDYFPISELHYIDSEDIPEALAENIKIIDLPKRLGALKIERFFGVQPVNKSKIEYYIENANPVQTATWLNDEFKAIKPILYALRQAKSAQALFLSAFKRLKIVICSEIEGYLLYDGTEYPLTLGPWEWLHHGDTAYILHDSDSQKQKLRLSNTFLADSLGAVIAAIFRLENGSDFARLIVSPRPDRIKLLEKILGGDATPDLKALEEEFEVASLGNDFNFDIPDSDEDVGDDAPGEIGSSDGEEDQAYGEIHINNSKFEEDTSGVDDHGPLDIDAMEHAPFESKRIKLRVQKKPSMCEGRRTGSHLVTDGEYCEKKVMEFELTDEPPRFPLHVGRVTGYNGPKCDILSFASLEDRDAFKETKKPELINRFIEVKGRSMGNASILLKGNELEAAIDYAERYYLYRLYVAGNGSYELSILQDPLQDSGAAIDLMEIDFESALTTRRFDLHGGINQGDHNAWDGAGLPNYDENSDTDA
jgi:hypothetical protein